MDLKINIPKRVTFNDINPLIDFKKLESEFNITTNPPNSPTENMNKRKRYELEIDPSEVFRPYTTIKEFLNFYCES